MPVAAPQVLPPNLGLLLERLEDTETRQLVIRGWSRECADDQHVWALWITGSYRIPPHPLAATHLRATAAPVLRLALHACTNCETVEVRDRTFDRIVDGSRLIAQGRRDGLLGWYAGGRKNGREYR